MATAARTKTLAAKEITYLWEGKNREGKSIRGEMRADRAGTIDIDEPADPAQFDDLFVVLDQESLQQERRTEPWTIEFRDEHASSQIADRHHFIHLPPHALPQPSPPSPLMPASSIAPRF